MKYPDYFYGSKSTFMTLPKAYQEYLIRLYYYDNTDELKIPDTVPVENIEQYIVERINSANVWCAKGFASARNVDNGDNLDFHGDCDFHIFVIYLAKLYFQYGIINNWFKEDISKEEFIKECNFLKGTYQIHF